MDALDGGRRRDGRQIPVAGMDGVVVQQAVRGDRRLNLMVVAAEQLRGQDVTRLQRGRGLEICSGGGERQQDTEAG